MSEARTVDAVQVGSKQRRIGAVRLLLFIAVLALEAAFNVGILMGRYRWKNDAAWVQPVFGIMTLTLCILLWALYRQAHFVVRGYLTAAEEA